MINILGDAQTKHPRKNKEQRAAQERLQPTEPPRKDSLQPVHPPVACVPCSRFSVYMIFHTCGMRFGDADV